MTGLREITEDIPMKEFFKLIYESRDINYLQRMNNMIRERKDISNLNKHMYEAEIQHQISIMRKHYAQK